MPLHPQVIAYLDAQAAQNAPGWEALTPAQAREAFSARRTAFGVGPRVHRVDDRTIADGVGITLYTPTQTAATGAPVVMYFHGGGWVLGDVETHDTLCRSLAVATSCVVVSVEYRRSPEHRFPAALNDCTAATAYVASHAGEIGVDPRRIVVAGDSAGGNLAAAVALQARDRGGPSLRGQVLIYPVVDDRCDTASYREFAEGYGLSRTSMRWFWRQYLGDDAPVPIACASLARAENLHDLPPAHVVTAEFDVLRDEGERYARRLAEAGVPTTVQRYDGMIHGFVLNAGIFDTAGDAIADIGEVVRGMVAE